MCKDYRSPFVIFVFIFLSLLSCEPKEPKGKETRTPAQPVKMYAGNPDLPEHEKQITSAGMGKIILGDPLNKVDQLYDSVVDLTLYKEGGEWSAKKVLFERDQWILVESIKSVNQITGIYTNYKEFKTRAGYYVGMPVNLIDLQKDSVASDLSLKSFFLNQSGVFFKIDQKAENRYFKSASPAPINDSTIKVDQFFIICGDC